MTPNVIGDLINSYRVYVIVGPVPPVLAYQYLQ